MDQQARRPVLAPCRLSTLPMISVSTPQQPSRPPDGQLIAESPLISAFGHGGSVRDGNFFFKPRPKAGDRYQNEKRLLSLLGGCGGGGAGIWSGVHEAAPAGCAGGGAGPSDPMAQFVPRYFGEVQLDGCWFFQMEDLLRSFSRVHMADIKMGVRCFSEDEVQNERPRPDLFDRMERLETMLGTPVRHVPSASAPRLTWPGTAQTHRRQSPADQPASRLYPSTRAHARTHSPPLGLICDQRVPNSPDRFQVLTAAERQAGAMTKARWMTLRDSLSSTRELGALAFPDRGCAVRVGAGEKGGGGGMLEQAPTR